MTDAQGNDNPTWESWSDHAARNRRRREREAHPPTDCESMAACILGGIRDCTFGEAARWLADNPAEARRYLRAAQLAIDHRLYLDKLAEERATRLYFWLGGEAEALANA